MKKHVQIFTDGACKGNPGPGGYGCIIRWNGREKEYKGADKLTTNNIMEMTAAIVALEELKEPCVVELTTDSKYLVDGITKWIHNWKKNNWIKPSDKKPVKNKALWQKLDHLAETHEITWVWVKGHAGHPENERADQLANEALALI